MTLKGKKVIVGISGGIAAYKSCFLIRLLVKEGAEVRVVTSPNALQFVTRLTLETLSNNRVYSDVFDETNDFTTQHVSLSDWADLYILAPATANIIAKLAGGIADDALSSSLIAFDKSVYIAPAMNDRMWNHFTVKRNLKTLKENGYNIILPAKGDLACGREGEGRMEEPENILAALKGGVKKKH
ncbi:MAG: flavoprotein [Bacteroidota bacterium]